MLRRAGVTLPFSSPQSPSKFWINIFSLTAVLGKHILEKRSQDCLMTVCWLKTRDGTSLASCSKAGLESVFRIWKLYLVFHLYSWLKKITLCVWLFVGACVPTYMWKSEDQLGVGSFLLFGSWGSNSGLQAWWQVPSLTEPFLWPYSWFLNFIVFCF